MRRFVPVPFLLVVFALSDPALAINKTLTKGDIEQAVGFGKSCKNIKRLMQLMMHPEECGSILNCPWETHLFEVSSEFSLHSEGVNRDLVILSNWDLIAATVAECNQRKTPFPIDDVAGLPDGMLYVILSVKSPTTNIMGGAIAATATHANNRLILQAEHMSIQTSARTIGPTDPMTVRPPAVFTMQHAWLGWSEYISDKAERYLLFSLAADELKGKVKVVLTNGEDERERSKIIDLGKLR